MTMWGAKRATNSTNGGHLAIMAKSTDWHTRLSVAKNPHSRPKTLMDLIRDRSECYEEVAGNPSTPMDVLVYMIEHPQLIKVDTPFPTTAGWKEIALRKDLSEEVYEAFSNMSIDMAPRLAQDLSGFSPHGQEDKPRPNSRVSPRVLFILASMKNTGSAYVAGNSGFEHFQIIDSVGYAIAHYGSHLDEQTMLVLVQNAVLRTDWPPNIEAKLINSCKDPLPRSVALALFKSDDTDILDWLQRASDLTESKKSVIRKRLRNRPEWVALETKRAEATVALETERAEKLKRQKIVDPSGKVVQEAALNSDVFDSPVEEVYWEAYRKSLPSALSGLVAQHKFGRYRLDFAIPKKKIGIELDGFEYHSSQEAIIKDRQRQRELEQQGWRIVRFAAKEVFDDPKGCVKQAARWAESL